MGCEVLGERQRLAACNDQTTGVARGSVLSDARAVSKQSVWRIGALAVALLFGGCTEDSSPPPAASTVSVPPELASGCPPPESPLRYANGDLPSGAIAVRLCPGQPTIAYTGDPLSPPIQAPEDELTDADDVAALVELVNGLPEAPAEQPCFVDDGPHHVYWFRYPDGDARAVAYDEAGCHPATLGDSVERQDGEEIATAFAAALFSQRADLGATSRITDVSAPACPPPPVSTPTSVLPVASVEKGLQLEKATWCVGVARSQMRSVEVPDSLLRRLNTNLLAAPVDGRDKCKGSSYGRWLVGETAWGDRVSYGVFGCRVQARTGFGRDNMSTVFRTDRALLTALTDLEFGPPARWGPVS